MKQKGSRQIMLDMDSLEKMYNLKKKYGAKSYSETVRLISNEMGKNKDVVKKERFI